MGPNILIIPIPPNLIPPAVNVGFLEQWI